MRNIVTVLIAVCSWQLIACTQQGSSTKVGGKLKGVQKDMTTGLIATYENMEPEEVFLVMNEEVLNHTDIP